MRDSGILVFLIDGPEACSDSGLWNKDTWHTTLYGSTTLPVLSSDSVSNLVFGVRPS